MESSGSRVFLAVALEILIPLVIVGIAVYRGRLAPRSQALEPTRTRARRAYLCILVWGIFIVVVSLMVPLFSKSSVAVQQGMGMLAGFLLGVPVTIVFLVGLFHALMVWHLPMIKLLLLLTVAFFALFFIGESLPTPDVTGPWDVLIGVVFGLSFAAIAARGLLGLRQPV